MRACLWMFSVALFACGGTTIDDTPPSIEHVLANAGLSLPGGAFGYLITANGQGDFVVDWTDSANSSAHFAGRISNESGFANVAPMSGAETISQPASNDIEFGSVPFAHIDGVSFTALSEPFTLDGLVDGSYADVNIYYANSQGQLVLVSSPASFVSP